MRKVVFLAAVWAAPVLGQEASDRGALLIRNGSDTVVVDRFIRTADTLKGTVQVKAQPRIDYLVVLGPNDVVRVFLLGIYAPGAAANASPVQRIRMVVQGDTVIAETPAGTQRVPTKVGAIPMFNNALALTELFTRRARATGGVADIPYFAINGGTTLTVAVRPATADSVTVTIAQQVERFRVDGVGRILGGTIGGSKLEFVRAGPDWLAAKLVARLGPS